MYLDDESKIVLDLVADLRSWGRHYVKVHVENPSDDLFELPLVQRPDVVLIRKRQVSLMALQASC